MKTPTETQSANGGRLERMVRRCVVCGARVVNHNPKTETCQPICTRAKHSKRTLKQQMEYELAHPDIDFDYPMNANNWDEPIGDE